MTTMVVKYLFPSSNRIHCYSKVFILEQQYVLSLTNITPGNTLNISDLSMNTLSLGLLIRALFIYFEYNWLLEMPDMTIAS